MIQNEVLVDLREVARRLSLSDIAARRALERGLIPIVRVGRRIRVRKTDLDDLTGGALPAST
jgi:excisionase family DNA binding protein